MKGQVKWFNQGKGYGFIEQEDGGDLFVHISQVDGRIEDGDNVEFEIGEGPKGPMAINVKRQNKETKTCTNCEKSKPINEWTEESFKDENSTICNRCLKKSNKEGKKRVDYNVFTVPQLKEKLRERGLKVSGVKAELITRLEDDDRPKNKSKKKKVRIDYNSLTVVELKVILKERNLPTVGLKAALVSRIIHDEKPKKKSLIIPSQVQEDGVHPHNIVHDGNLEKNQEYLLDRLNTGHSLLIYCLNVGEIATRVKLTKLQATTEKSFSSFVVKPMSWPNHSINKKLGMKTHPLMSRMILSAVIVSSKEIEDESPFISILAQKVHEHFFLKGRNQQAWTILGDETGPFIDYAKGEQWTGERAVPSSMLWVVVPPKSHTKLPMMHPYFHAIESRFYEDTKAGIAALSEHPEVLCFVFSYESGKLPENLPKKDSISGSKHLAMWQYTLPLVLEILSQHVSDTKDTDIDIFLERVDPLIPGLESGTLLQQFSVALSNRKGWGKMVVRDSPVIAKNPLEHGWLGYPDVLGHLLWPQNSQAYGKITNEHIVAIKNRWIRAPFRQDSLSGPIHQALMDTARSLVFLKSLAALPPKDIRDYIEPFFLGAISEALEKLTPSEWQELLFDMITTSKDKKGQDATVLILRDLDLDATLDKLTEERDKFDLLMAVLGSSNHVGSTDLANRCKVLIELMREQGYKPPPHRLFTLKNLSGGANDNQFDFSHISDDWEIPEDAYEIFDEEANYLGAQAHSRALRGEKGDLEFAWQIEELLLERTKIQSNHKDLRRRYILRSELLMDQNHFESAIQVLEIELPAALGVANNETLLNNNETLLDDAYYLASLLKACALSGADNKFFTQYSAYISLNDSHPSQRIAYWFVRWASEIAQSSLPLVIECCEHLIHLKGIEFFTKEAPGVILACELLDLESRGLFETDATLFMEEVIAKSEPPYAEEWVAAHPPNAEDWLAPLNFNYR